MSGSRSNWFQRAFLFRTPLYRRRACGNFHPVWGRLCFCRVGEHWPASCDGTGGWHGGIMDLKTGEELLTYREFRRRGVQHDSNGMCTCRECDEKRVTNELRARGVYVTHGTRGEFERRFGVNPRPAFVEAPSYVDRPADRIAVDARKEPVCGVSSCSDDLDRTMRELAEVVGRHAPNYAIAGVACVEDEPKEGR